MPTLRPISIRRAATAALAGAMILSILPAATAVGASEPPPEIKQVEWTVLGHLNKVRANHGLKPLRMATRVRLVARDRSRSMKNQDYFAHTSPSGATAASMMNHRGVKYDSWGENIGWTKYFGLDEGAKWMVDWWKNSPAHRRNMLDPNFNYVGVGVAKDGPKVLWTTVFVTQRDHTPPLAGLLSSSAGISVAASGTADTARVNVKWWGKDRPLSTRTAGLKGFTIQYKRGEGPWKRIRKETTARQLTKALAVGTHEFRVRAVDKKGNRGAWQRPLVVTVR